MKKRTLILTALLCLLRPMMAQQAAASADIERLTATMYRYFSTDSVEQFMGATDSLKALCLKDGDEKTFYKAWGNQASYTFSKVSREKGLAIAREERAYAEKHDSKYGLYSSSNTNATLMSSSGMIDLAEKAFLEAIDYQRRYFPEENIAFQYIGLAKIEHNRHHFEKCLEYAEKALAEKDVQPIHRLHAYSYLCAALGELASAYPDEGSYRQRFNQAYEQRAQVLKEHQLQDAMGGIVNFYEAKVNGRYSELPALALKVQSQVNRLAFIQSAWAANGDYKKAYEAFKEYKAYSDSVNRAEIRQAASESTIQLNLVKAENEMKDLRLANQEHREHVHHIIMGAVGTMAALVIGFLIFYLYRHRRHEQELETAYGQLETAHEKLESAHEQLESAYAKLEETTKAKERIESELRIARDIQMGMVPSIFPAFPERNDVDLHAVMIPAKEVGGDLYDFFIQNDRLYFCVGDVSGKGIPASLFMSVVVNIFRMVAKEGFPPEYIATKLNDALSTENDNGMFCTMFIGEIDLRTGRMNYCNAGHTPPVIIDRPLSPHAPCRPAYLEMESNAPIGLWPDLEFVGERVESVRGRTLFIYTDGLTEAENLSQEQFGEDRLIKLFETRPYQTTRQALDLVYASVAAFVGEAEPSDDLTMLCIKIV